LADISRVEALSLINQQNSNEVWQQAAETSAALRSFRQVRMSVKQQRMPVIDVLPTAAFVTGDTGTKVTAEQAWVTKMLEVEEIAAIVPIPENVFDDASFNIWSEVRPRVAEAVGKVLDGAVFFGTNKPASWPDSLEDGARAAGNLYSMATAGDLAEDINQTIALVEADGFDPNVIWSRRKLRAKLRGLRDNNLQPIYSTSLKSDGAVPAVYGIDLEYVTNGAWVEPVASPAAGAEVIVGDRTMAILGIRSDMQFKILTEATLTDGAGNVVFSLAEQDMIALRVKMRVAFQVADPTTIEGGSAAYPFAVLGS
jgi:HK97 family phage major capsid protein